MSCRHEDAAAETRRRQSTTAGRLRDSAADLARRYCGVIARKNDFVADRKSSASDGIFRHAMAGLQAERTARTVGISAGGVGRSGCRRSLIGASACGVARRGDGHGRRQRRRRPLRAASLRRIGRGAGLLRTDGRRDRLRGLLQRARGLGAAAQALDRGARKRRSHPCARRLRLVSRRGTGAGVLAADSAAAARLLDDRNDADGVWRARGLGRLGVGLSGFALGTASRPAAISTASPAPADRPDTATSAAGRLGGCRRRSSQAPAASSG